MIPGPTCFLPFLESKIRTFCVVIVEVEEVKDREAEIRNQISSQ